VTVAAALIDRSSDVTEPLVLCALGVCAGVGLFFYGFRLLQRRRLILDTPFSRIRSASMGMVEVSGLAVGPYTMIAPITARSCYYYRTLVWEWKQRGRNKQWVKIAGECMHVPFFVDDGTGLMLVDPRGAELDLYRDFRQEFNGFFSNAGEAPGNVNSFLARHGVTTSNKIRVEEYCIKPKNSLFILGTLAENPGVRVAPEPVSDSEALSRGMSLSIASLSGSLSLGLDSGSLTLNPRTNDPSLESFSEPLAAEFDSTGPRIVHLSPDAGPVKTPDMTQQQRIAAALMKAGISNPAAWAAAGVTTGASAGGVVVMADPLNTDTSGNGSKTAASSATTANGFDPHPPVVLMKGVNNKTFLISWRSQREVASALGWKCALMIWGGPALALLSLYLFLGLKNQL